MEEAELVALTAVALELTELVDLIKSDEFAPRLQRVNAVLERD